MNFSINTMNCFDKENIKNYEIDEKKKECCKKYKKKGVFCKKCPKK